MLVRISLWGCFLADSPLRSRAEDNMLQYILRVGIWDGQSVAYNMEDGVYLSILKNVRGMQKSVTHAQKGGGEGLLWQTIHFAKSNYKWGFYVFCNSAFWDYWLVNRRMRTHSSQHKVGSGWRVSCCVKVYWRSANSNFGALSKSLLSRGRPRAELAVCTGKWELNLSA